MLDVYLASIVAHGDQGCNLHLDMADWLVSSK